MKSARAVLFLLAGACLPALPARAATPPEPVVTPIPTEITSTGPGEMISTATETIFTFQDQVVVTGTNLKLTCDRLVVVAKRTGDPKATFGKQENFKSLLATGRVRIVQNDREATCDRAEVLPGDDKVTLEGNVTARSLDNRFVQSGPKATLYRNQMRAVFEQPRFVLPPIKDLGPGKDKAKAGTPPASEPAATSAPITVPLPATPSSPK